MAEKPQKTEKLKSEKMEYAFTKDEVDSVTRALDSRRVTMTKMAKDAQNEGKEDAAKIFRREVDLLQALSDDMKLELT